MDTENPKTAIEYIHSLGRFSGKPGLHRIKALCEALGNPQDRLKFVHLAGTNGKGSTACMIASALQAAGLRTARANIWQRANMPHQIGRAPARQNPTRASPSRASSGYPRGRNSHPPARLPPTSTRQKASPNSRAAHSFPQ